MYHFTEDTHHHHLVCRRCGLTTEIPEGILETMRDDVLRDYAFEIQLQHLTITGQCVECPPPPAAVEATHAHHHDGHHHPHSHS